MIVEVTSAGFVLMEDQGLMLGGEAAGLGVAQTGGETGGSGRHECVEWVVGDMDEGSEGGFIGFIGGSRREATSGGYAVG